MHNEKLRGGAPHSFLYHPRRRTATRQDTLLRFVTQLPKNLRINFYHKIIIDA